MASKMYACQHCYGEFTQQGWDRHRYSEVLRRCITIELRGDDVTSYICKRCKEYFFTALNKTNTIKCPYCGKTDVEVDKTDNENPKE